MPRILVVEDVAPSRALTRSALLVKGHDVVDAATAEQALTAISREHFDLILLNLFLRGENGYELLDQIALATGRGGTPIVTMSEMGDEVDFARTTALGAIDHLQKPFGFADLDATVSSLLTTRIALDEVQDAKQRGAVIHEAALELTEHVETG
jgi:DNA-binding response OmpR family regulator